MRSQSPRPARHRASRPVGLAATLALAATSLVGIAAPPASGAERSAALVGDLQSELGCPGDWQPDCAATELAPTGTPGVFSADFTLPAGTWEYKVALDDAWDESYGFEGENVPLVLAGDAVVRVTYDDASHRVALTPLDLAGDYSAVDDDLVADPVRQPGSDERFYFVMTDRFANGDPNNDEGGLAGDRLATGFDPTDKGFYHGGDLAGLHANLDYIEGLGTTAIWLTPSFLNRPVQGAGADASAGYHGYWITDFTQIDPHLGTNAELEALIADAHDRDIKVYFDIITNHTADVIDYAEGQYSYIDQATSPYRDAAGNVFDPADFAGTDDFPDLDPETSFPYTPVIAPEDADLKVPAWLNDPTLYHHRGNSTWTGESVTFGDFDGLDDLMTEHPTVVDGFIDVYQDWIDLGIDGFRIDTAKHVNFEFWEKWTTEVLDYAHAHGKPDFFMFGEVYDADAAKLAPYVRGTDMSSVLDFTFQSAAANFARGFTPDSLANLFASDDWYTTPTSSAAALPTFLGNHDMGRIGHFVKDSGSALERSELAHALMFLTRGQPVVYYGDEQGFVGAGSLGGGDKDARQSLFATQVAEYANQDLLTGEQAGSQDRFDADAPLYEHIAGLSALRESLPALSDGAQIERPDSGPGAGSVYAFSRVLRSDQVEHLVALNNDDAAAQVEVTSLTPGATFSSAYGDHANVTADDDGVVQLTVPALGAVVLVADAPVGAVVGGPSISLDAPAPGAAVSGSALVAATIVDTWAETSFAYRVVGEDGWTPLGTSESTTPRVRHDVDLQRGTLVEYRAVTVDAAGERAAASTFASVGVPVDGVDEPDPGPGPGGAFVTVPGSFNAAVGCPGDWQPDCEAIALTHQGNDIYGGTFDIPAGSWEYKVAVGGSWDENYGAGGAPGGDNVTFSLDAPSAVTFVYDHRTHRFTSSAQGELVTLPGSFQSEVGCPGDWAPDCLGTWLAPVGDGTYTFTTDLIPAGAWEVKVAHGLSWDVNFGEGGVPGGANVAFTAPGGKPVTFTYDGATHILTIEVTDPPLTGLGQHRAHWIDAQTIAWPTELTPDGPDGLSWSLHHEPGGVLEVSENAVVGGESTPLELAADGLTPAQADRFPHLAGYLALRLPDDVAQADVESWLTGELLVSQHASGGAASVITGVQIPGVLDDVFAAAAERELGVTWRKKTPTLALWAPTATDVDLLLWRDGRGTGDPQRVDMTRGADGTWTVVGKKSWRGKAYRFEVDVYAPSVDALVTNEVTDPYSVALTENSTHSVLVDLADKAFAPKTWAKAKQPRVRPVDQTIYELHVRDFSISDTSVPEKLRGTYGAFAHQGKGAKHLKSLAKAGLTTVHLLPTFDIASIEEDRDAQVEPPCDLASFAPDSPEQQACIEPIRDLDGFNWGYDPWHFSTPEGSYAVDAEGGARVAEFRTMVGALHGMGLQVVLDKVYNHTAASGQDGKSVLDRVVPGYYHRLNATGGVETSTCCQNLATEHTMMEKLMVDSVVTWARDYKVDGFRFDLMGHHSVENMAAVREALDALTVKRDGVDGKRVYLYGEGWNFGEVADNARFEQATQGQLGGTGIGTFSDRLRDAVRGGGPFDEDPRLQGFGSGGFTDPNGAPVNGSEADQLARAQHDADLVRLGMAGNLRDFAFLAADGEIRSGAELDYNGQPAGYADSPEEIITYVDAHDNETLFDALTFKLPTETSMADRVRMNTVALATTALAQTPSFWHAGADLLRSKSLDRNSYNSGDWFNVLDFSGRDNGFGRGLPPAGDNQDKWPFQQPLLADPALKPAPADIARASANAKDLLRLRFSTDLFRLGSAELIEQKVSFPGSGPDAQPGVVVMHVDDTVGRDVDRQLDRVVVVVNASPDDVVVPVAGLEGERLALSDVQRKGSDPVVKQARWDARAGTASVPARTVAVFVDEQRPGKPGPGKPGKPGDPGPGKPGKPHPPKPGPPWGRCAV